MDKLFELYAVDKLRGYSDEDINYLKQLFGSLPLVLEDYFRTAGRTEAFHRAQDTWMLPEHFQEWAWLQKADYLILLNENQGVCRAGIRREDLLLPDPPVYTTEDDETWVLCAPATSEFLLAALYYESVFTFEHSPKEFYWLSEKDMTAIQSQLTKLPYEFSNWINGIKVSFYSNAEDNLVAVMDCGGDLQMLYGAVSADSYAKLRAVLEGIGEAM
jgi:hypothetical protein